MPTSSHRTPLWLAALALAAFAVQTDDFVIIGVLAAIAEGTHVSETAAGQLVTAYSLIYALTAPVWAVALARVPRRALLVWALTVFTAANIAVLAVDGYWPLMALRVVAALAAAVVLPTALAVAGAAAPADRKGRYLAAVMTGLTGAILIGVPAGTWIGAAFGWRATFVFGGLLGAAALLLAAPSLPRESAEGASAPSRTALVRPLLNTAVAGVLAVTVLAVAGNLAFQTYISVLLSGIADVGPRLLAVLLVCAGAGGLAGTQAAGRLVDRFGASATFFTTGALFCAAMAALAGLWLLRPVPVALAAVLLVGWSAAAWAIPPTLQALMLSRTGTEAATQAMAVHSASVYVGAAAGGVAGGAALSAGAGLLPVAAAVSMALALAVCGVTGRRAAVPAQSP
ncbi:MFS transporter [Streptomonospora nanhaiensis]|uniref:Putative MFS family arabinose efflux permease n=1 Tax=Streptomonospora nanhaiensis TaxID=1323731 RepID=A0A853BQM4_9ACTN|nr:MFS transporter [Streptomonospora nanhaiensis]MBX9387633.1 MFS transporter [Streptomonospora nanhaiensis]NYI97134.1 putative MFS family arabinose efflux permease [Streptomonospora nanhaiensis]